MVTVFTFPHAWITEGKYKGGEGGGEEGLRRVILLSQMPSYCTQNLQDYKGLPIW